MTKGRTHHFEALALTLLLISVLSVPSMAQSSASKRFIPFQAQVTQQNGTLVDDGQYSVVFNFYNTAIGGQPIWSERHTKIGVTGGALNVFLGSINPITSVDFSTAKYLGITVDVDGQASTAEPEMVPRSVIIPAFHAKTAEFAEFARDALHIEGADILDADTKLRTIVFGTDSIPGDALKPNEISADKLAPNSVESSEIAPGAVGSGELAGNAVSTDHIQDESIIITKLGGRRNTPAINQNASLGEVAISDSSGNYSNSTGDNEVATNQIISISTSGRPVRVFLIPEIGGSGGYIRMTGSPNPPTEPNAIGNLRIRRSGGGTTPITHVYPLIANQEEPRISVPPGAISLIDFPPIGSWTYQLLCSVDPNTAPGTLAVIRCRIVAYEL